MELLNSSTQLHIRKATMADAGLISELVLANAEKTLYEFYSPIQQKVFAKYYSRDAVIEKIATQDILCGELNNQVVGTVALKDAFVLGFYTHPDYLGKGIGTVLMQALERMASQNGIYELELAASPVGVAYYIKHGWELVGEEDFDYEGVLFRETRMRKRLTA